MKERIEFITESTIKGRKEISKINEYVNNFNFDCGFSRKIEQVPETWEELKDLCKKTGIEVEENYIELFGVLVGSNILFCEDGAIMLNTDCCFAEKVSIERMWQIIKNLIKYRILQLEIYKNQMLQY